MTRPTGEHEDEDTQTIVIHWDGSGFQTPAPEAVAPPPAFEPEPVSRPPFLQRIRYWLVTAAVLIAVMVAGYAVGEVTYNPEPRLPAQVFDTADPLYGINPSIQAELDIVRDTFSDPDALALEPVDGVFRLPLPRTVADRLFGERDESMTVFTTEGAAGTFRFLRLTGEATDHFYIEAPFGLSSRQWPSGVYLALDPADPTLAPVLQALQDLQDDIDARPAVHVSPDDYYAFGPYQGADTTSLRDRIESNTVMAHLVQALEAQDAGVSVAAPVILIGAGPSRGVINAIYHPARRLVMEPLWGTSSTASLAHELVHAYIDTVVEDEEAMLSDAASYLERNHPVLHGRVVGDLYERLGPHGRAEESLAFITGAIASGQTKTVPAQQLLENTANVQLSEALLYSDVEFLVRYGLLPACMLPRDGEEGELQPSFYDNVAQTCP